MRKKLLVICTALLLSACVTAQDSFEQEMEVGTTYVDTLVMPKGDIFLPPGEWTVMGSATVTSNSGHSYGDAVLGKVTANNKLDGLIILSTSLDLPMRYGFHSARDCTRDTIGTLYIDKTTNAELGSQRCLRVRAISMDLSGSLPPELLQAKNYIAVHKITVSDKMLVSKHHIVRRNKLLRIQYAFDFQQPTDDMIPDYQPVTLYSYDKPFGNALWETNLETVISWSREKQNEIAATFLD